MRQHFLLTEASIGSAVTGCGVSIIRPSVPEGNDLGDVKEKVKEIMTEVETLQISWVAGQG